MTHKYRAGETVHFTPPRGAYGGARIYEVVRLLPIEHDRRLRYRIRSATESYERIADEAQLSHAT